MSGLEKDFNGQAGTSRLGGRVAFSVEGHKGEVYTVHVFQKLPDHTATFNWYEVDLNRKSDSSILMRSGQ